MFGAHPRRHFPQIALNLPRRCHPRVVRIVVGGEQVELDRSLYAVPEPGLAIGSFVAAIDDAGRITVAMNMVAIGGSAEGLRVLVFE